MYYNYEYCSCEPLLCIEFDLAPVSEENRFIAFLLFRKQKFYWFITKLANWQHHEFLVCPICFFPIILLQTNKYFGAFIWSFVKLSISQISNDLYYILRPLCLVHLCTDLNHKITAFCFITYLKKYVLLSHCYIDIDPFQCSKLISSYIIIHVLLVTHFFSPKLDLKWTPKCAQAYCNVNGRITSDLRFGSSLFISSNQVRLKPYLFKSTKSNLIPLSLNQ